MATKIGSLIISLAVEHGLLVRGLSVAEKEVAKTTRAIERKGREIADFGQKLSLAVSLPIAGLAVASVKAAKESADALGQVNAALASMGNAAGRTTEQLQALAGSQMSQSLYDDDQILREVTANLLTFGKVSGEQFDRAQQAALDLATRLGTDLTSATIQIGKALNDPVKGITALGRAGIQFSADQKAMIASMAEAGNVAGAQKIILAELEKQFGGAAKAAREADPGAALAQSFAQFQEDVGAKLLPLLPAITTAITGVLDAFGALPGGVQSTIIVVAGLAAALGPVLIGLGAMVSTSASTIAVLSGLKLAFDFGGVIKNLIPMIGMLSKAMLGLLANPVILGAAVVIGGIFLAWQNWDKIKPIIDRVTAAVVGFWNDNVKPVLSALGGMLGKAVRWWIDLQLGALKAIAGLVSGVKDWLQGKLAAVLEWVIGKVQAVSRAFFDLYDDVVGNSFVPDMVEGIRAEMAKLDAFMVQPANKAAQAVSDRMKAMAERVRSILAELYPEIEASNAKAAKVADLFGAERAGLITKDNRRDAVRRAQGFDQGPLEQAKLVEEATVEIGDALERQTGRAELQTVRIAQTFEQMTQDILGSLRGLADGIKKGDFFSIFEGILGVVTKLGAAGVFGKGFQARMTAVPGNANGTAYHPGGLMMVGERGPEILSVPSGGRVVPNHELRQAGSKLDVTVTMDESTGALGAFVRNAAGQVVAQAAPSIAAAGAGQAVNRIRQMQDRRLA